MTETNERITELEWSITTCIRRLGKLIGADEETINGVVESVLEGYKEKSELLPFEVQERLADTIRRDILGSSITDVHIDVNKRGEIVADNLILELPSGRSVRVSANYHDEVIFAVERNPDVSWGRWGEMTINQDYQEELASIQKEDG